MSDLQDIREYNAFHLADRAECGEPSSIVREGDIDSANSPGADFLDSVRTDFLEAVEYSMGTDNTAPSADDIRTAVAALQEDGAHEIADGAVPVYTHEMWRTFVDVAAWQEDDEYGDGWGDDLTKAAMRALYQIANRLVLALASELEEWADALEESETDAELDGYDYDSAHETVEDRDARIAELTAAHPVAEFIVQRSDSGLFEVYISSED